VEIKAGASESQKGSWFAGSLRVHPGGSESSQCYQRPTETARLRLHGGREAVGRRSNADILTFTHEGEEFLSGFMNEKGKVQQEISGDISKALKEAAAKEEYPATRGIDEAQVSRDRAREEALQGNIK